MKQCAVCSRTYTDETLEFCLDDGARLFLVRESETTLVRGATPPPPAWPPQPLPPPDWSQQPTPVQPVPTAKSRAWIPLALALIAAGILIGSALVLLVYMNQPSSPPVSEAENRTPAPTPKTRPGTTPTPDSIATPTPKATPKVTPTPAAKETPEAKPSPTVEPTAKPTPKPGGCIIANDDANQPDVNLRANCHVKSCDEDNSTIIGTARNGTSVTVNRQVAPVKGRNFAWQQVTLSGGRTAWVAASKIRCP